MKTVYILLGALALITGMSASRADEISDEIARKKDAEASAAKAHKEANSLLVPNDVLKKLDYRDWACQERDGKSVGRRTINGRVNKIYFQGDLHKPPKVFVTFFIIESKDGQMTEIYFDPGKQGMSVGVKDRAYLDLLLKRIRH